LLTAGCFLLATDQAWALKQPGMNYWFPENVSTAGAQIDRLFTLILGMTGAIFVLVEGVLLWCLIRYRHRRGRTAAYFHDNARVEIVWTVIPALVVLYLTVASQRVWSYVRGTPPRHQLEVEVTAEQFAWNVRYPGQDGRFGSSDDIETINQLHLPVGQVALVRLKSKDVIHGFFIPHFRIKHDAVPGLTSRIWLQATKAGQFEIACAELCGLGHYRMRGFLTTESPEDFQAWLATTQAEQVE
jgi:cytochrome c oxidase subunit 2